VGNVDTGMCGNLENSLSLVPVSIANIAVVKLLRTGGLVPIYSKLNNRIADVPRWGIGVVVAFKNGVHSVKIGNHTHTVGSNHLTVLFMNVAVERNVAFHFWTPWIDIPGVGIRFRSPIVITKD
jgi:hypothetical protein